MKYKPEIVHHPEPVMARVNKAVPTLERISIPKTVLSLYKLGRYWGKSIIKSTTLFLLNLKKLEMYTLEYKIFDS